MCPLPGSLVLERPSLSESVSVGNNFALRTIENINVWFDAWINHSFNLQVYSNFLISIILFAIFSRFIPHPPNFTPITAIALLSSKGFTNRWIILLIPMISLFISDLFLGLHDSIPFVYGAFILITLLGMSAKKIEISTVLMSSTIFFLVSNFGVWF